ncbi:MAG: RluA family pseudouridine synthase [Clostridia bacterium]|nr:RluA family pseudouridine synthase [Clostridia bacterium]
MGRVLSVEINSVMHGQKIDCVLKNQFKISDALMKQLKRDKNGIMLNDAHADVIDKVSRGDILVVNIKGKNAENIIPVNIPLDVIWEDEDILVVNKPGTMPVHPSRIHINDTLLNAVMYYMANGEIVHIITRLDRETSGVVLIAKNPWAAALMGEDIKNGKIKKEYIAVVNGIPEPFKGRICAPIIKKEERKILRCVSEDGKEAVTEYELIKKTDKLSLIKLFPITGRTHQLRVHMSYIGHPIYGDSMYGAAQTGERTRLHCQRITFIHPVTGEKISVTAPTPEDFIELAQE